MTSVTLVFKGPPEQKHVVQVPPMGTLQQHLVAACAKFRPPLDASRCQLQLGKAAVDLGTPFRLLNIPSGSKLEVVQGAAPGGPAAPSTAAAAAAAAAPPAGAVPSGPSTAPDAPAASQSAPAVVQPTMPAAGNGTEVTLPQHISTTTPSTTTTTPAAAAAAAAAADAPTPPPQGSQPGQPSSAAAAASSSAGEAEVPPELAALGVTRPLLVFTQAALERAGSAAGSSSEDLPDDFYDLTPEDLALLQQHHAARAKAEAGFRTRAKREAQAAAAAAGYGPVRLRLHLPGGTLVQATFDATDQLAAVQALAAAISLPELRPGLHLYTTPPKTTLKDMTATLAAAQLVPAAHIHVGYDLAKCQGLGPAAAAYQGPYLQPAVAALLQQELPQELAPAPPQPAAAAAEGDDSQAAADPSSLRAAAAAARSGLGGGGGASSAAAPGAKVPKWMKLGAGR